MKYVDRVLEEGERVIYTARVHWWVYIYAIAWTAGMASLALWGLGQPEPVPYIAGAVIGCLFLTPILALTGAITRWTTELAITDRRVIAKTGWIRRNTPDISTTKVEGVKVDQSVRPAIRLWHDHGNRHWPGHGPD